MLAFVVLFVSLLAGCDSPAQIVEISPQRGAVDVRTNLPLRVRFDRAVDRTSVVQRFRVSPAAPGQVRWTNSNTLVWDHPPLAVDTEYTVSLESGFRDQAGIASGFRHSWKFRTESAPALTSSIPAALERGVDPATYLSIGFSREMNAGSFQSAISITPEIPYQVRSDPTDPRRVVVAPRSLLLPGTDYVLRVDSGALDADGNHLPASKVTFSTGEVRSLQHWITFIAAGGPISTGAGIWMVDENRFPRLLTDQTADSFTWSPDGTSLLIRRPDGSWVHVTPGADNRELPFSGPWAAYLGPERGYLYLEDGKLERLRPDLGIDHIAVDVGEVAVAPDLARVAFTVGGNGPGEIDGYDLTLRARYVLVRDGQSLSGLAWSPNGLRLAYILAGSTSAHDQLRVKALSGAGSVSTIATGAIAEPVWLADSNYIAFSAIVDVGGQPRSRIFRVNASLPPAVLTAQVSLAGALAADATSPRPSPDGHQIAFLSPAEGGPQVWLMNADGTGLERLTTFAADTFPYSCRSPHWSGI